MINKTEILLKLTLNGSYSKAQAETLCSSLAVRFPVTGLQSFNLQDIKYKKLFDFDNKKDVAKLLELYKNCSFNCSGSSCDCCDFLENNKCSKEDCDKACPFFQEENCKKLLRREYNKYILSLIEKETE